MAAKNKIQVLIGGKIYTLSGYESEEYLQKVAAYLNNKITEIRSIDGYQRLSPEMRSLLLNLNTADDYFKLKKQADQLGDQIAEKDRELYEIKHELISVQMQTETKDKALAALQEEAQSSAKRIVQLETQLEALKDRKG
jgi:cell division protein ZapA